MEITYPKLNSPRVGAHFDSKFIVLEFSLLYPIFCFFCTVSNPLILAIFFAFRDTFLHLFCDPLMHTMTKNTLKTLKWSFFAIIHDKTERTSDSNELTTTNEGTVLLETFTSSFSETLVVAAWRDLNQIWISEKPLQLRVVCRSTISLQQL